MATTEILSLLQAVVRAAIKAADTPPALWGQYQCALCETEWGRLEAHDGDCPILRIKELLAAAAASPVEQLVAGCPECVNTEGIAASGAACDRLTACLRERADRVGAE